jgi:hypothetical protein
MSSPDKSERSDSAPNLDYVPRWAGSAEGEPSRQRERSSSKRDLSHSRRSLDPEIVNFPQPRSRLRRFAHSAGFVVAVALGVVIGLLVTGDFRSIVEDTLGYSTKTTEFTGRFDSKTPQQASSPTTGLVIAPTAPQSANGTPARVATVGGTNEPAPTVRGVTDSEIRFGISAPLTGPAKELGQNMKLGIEAAFNAANANGGVYGRQLRLVAADDGYEPARTAATMKQLYEKIGRAHV